MSSVSECLSTVATPSNFDFRAVHCFLPEYIIGSPEAAIKCIYLDYMREQLNSLNVTLFVINSVMMSRKHVANTNIPL